MAHKKPILGAHLSGAGGLYKVFDRAQAINANALQLFTKSNRQWHAKPLTTEEINLFKQAHERSDVKILAAHASYLINIGSFNEEIHKKSIAALTEEIERCQALEIPYLVLHPGSCGENNKTQCIERIAQQLNAIFRNVNGKTMVLLENAAGQGSSIGSELSDLYAIYQLVDDKSRVGICIDTCHAFAAGYDLRNKDRYEAFWKEYQSLLPLESLKMIHLNDSKKPLGSHKDRHENIGKGELGREAFVLIMNDARLNNVPKILETPKDGEVDDNKIYAEEIQYLTSLVEVR